MTVEATYEELIARAAPWLRGLPPLHTRYSEDQDRDESGRFAGGGGGGGGGSSSAPDRDGNYTEDGVSYDRDANRLTDGYVSEYGKPVTYSTVEDHSLVLSQRGEYHIMRNRDDPTEPDSGLMVRESRDVEVSGLSQSDVRAIADDSGSMIENEAPRGESRSTGAGMTLTVTGESAEWGLTLSNGGSFSITNVNGPDLFSAFDSMADAYDDYSVGTRSRRKRPRRRKRTTYGSVVMSPYPEVRERFVQYLNLPELPAHLRYSEDQDRDENGRFAGGGGGGGGGSSGRGSPGSGRDLTHDQATMQSVYENNVDENGQWRDQGNGDPALVDIAAHQGFDAKPTVVSNEEFDRITATEGHEVLYRGVQGTGETSASAIHTEVREGEYRPGYGIFGNGYYMAPDESKAASFSDHTPGSLGRYALHSDAKTVDYDALKDRYDREVFSSYQSQPRAVQAVTSDWGRYAASLGYDAIRVPAGTRMIGGSSVQRTEYVILNRGALIAAGGS